MSDTPPRQVALSIVRRLRERGFVAYFAGGCVRDELLGLTPKDYDIATDATPDAVAGLFRRVREVGKSFGVMLVSLSGVTVEVSTFRREHGYSDRRRPDTVEFCDARSDSMRRDFTINALFIDPLDRGEGPGGRVIDFVGGLADVGARLVRAVGDPELRLAEDHLRALRAVRFSARLGFRLESGTRDAIKKHALELVGVSRERIGEEVRLMLKPGARAVALALLESLSLDQPVLTPPPTPPTTPPPPTTDTNTLSEPLSKSPVVAGESRGSGSLGCVKALPDEPVSVGLALAAWAADRAGPGVAGRAIAASADELVGKWRRAMCLSNEETDELRSTLSGVGLIEAEWPGLGKAKRKRAAASAWFAGALRIVSGRDSTTAQSVSAEVVELARDGIGLAPRGLVTGDDLIAAGLAPGPSFGRWLELAYDAQLEGRLRTRGEALATVMGWAEGEAAGGEKSA